MQNVKLKQKKKKIQKLKSLSFEKLLALSQHFLNHQKSKIMLE
jgi:hypothetical protein